MFVKVFAPDYYYTHIERIYPDTVKSRYVKKL